MKAVITTCWMASLLEAVGVTAFVMPATTSLSSTRLFSTQTDTDVWSLSLTKPLGVILEENVQGTAAGVFVKQVGDAGSAAAFADEMTGCKLLAVQGVDMTSADFDTVMDAIVNAPDTVELELQRAVDDFPVGTVVTVTAEQSNGEDLVFEAKVGDNLRQALLDNGFEVYQGMKQKLGNCGGGGSCTFCAMDIIESQGWPERSDYEDKKLAKNPNARLACLNPIQGPVKLRKAQR